MNGIGAGRGVRWGSPLRPRPQAVAVRGPGAGLSADEALRLARGWRRTLEMCERIKRLDEGRPLVPLVQRSAWRSGVWS